LGFAKFALTKISNQRSVTLRMNQR
jgi:hypothetical protein